MRLRLPLPVLLCAAMMLVCLVLLQSCGGGSPSSSGSPSPTPPQQSQNPAPTITAFSPSTLTTQSIGTSLTVNGTGFMQGSTLTWNGQSHSFTFVSSTQLQVAIAAADVASTGNVQLAVSNAGPGGGTSSASLPIVYPGPSITGLSPKGIQFGSKAFTLIVNGTGFTPVSTVMWNGAPRTTTFVTANSLKAAIAAADIANVGMASITVSTPTPGGGVSSAVSFNVSGYPFPNITNLTPSSAVINSPDTAVIISGTGFLSGSTVQVGGTTVPSFYNSSGTLSFTIPASELTAIQTYAITVTNPAPGGGVSSAATFNVVPNPQPVLSSISQSTAPVGIAGLTVTVSGTGFSPNSVVRWNGSDRVTSYASPSTLKVTLPASDFIALGNSALSVFNSPPGGGSSSTLPFTTYLPLSANDLVYSSATQMLYASVPSTGGSTLGNSIVPIDPVTGNLGTPIWVGSEPGRMALSSDGKTLYVGLTGAAAVRQVNLATSTAGLQFSLGGGGGLYNSPNSPISLAVMPGSASTVAVGFSNYTGIGIFDDGVARGSTGSSGLSNVSGLAFDPSGNKIYAAGNGYAAYPVTSSGLGSPTASTSQYSSDLRFDNGRVYLTNGAVLDAVTGTQLGIFSTSPNTPASGSVAPDSGVGKAFILLSSFTSQSNQINIYDLNSFVALGNIPLGNIGQSSPGPQPRLIRSGQNGLAFSTGTQIYILRSNLVSDLSSTATDLGLTVSGPPSATTGSSVTLTYTITNHGSATAVPVSFTDQLPAGMFVQSLQPSTGTCAGTTVVRCDLGGLAANASATVQISMTPLTAATMQDAAQISAPQTDPDLSNNTASANVVVTGSDYSPMPVIASVFPSLVQKGASGVALFVNGYQFDASSVVEWNGVAIPTTFVSSNILLAQLDPTQLAGMGWAWVNVTNATPGGGSSSQLPVTIYDTVDLDANNIVFDPFTRKIYASLPSTATQVTGNSIVALDPNTRSLGTPTFVGSEPTKMAESDDGKFLYVILKGSNSLGRIDLTSGLLAGNYSLAVANPFGDTPAPRDLAVQPGHHDTLAVDLGSWLGKGVFDISGSTGAYRGGLTGPYNGSSLTFPNASQLYTYDSDTSGALFYRWTVTGTGLTALDSSTINGMGGFSGSFRLDHGLLYGGYGALADPAVWPAKQLGQYALNPPLFPYPYFLSYGVAPDATLNRVFYLGQRIAGQTSNYLLSFDQQRLTPLTVNQLPGSAGGDLLRWGKDGLAMRLSNGTVGSGQILLLRGPLVLPQWYTNNATPTLTTVSTSTITSGSGNQMLTVTGSGFVPGAVVLWNGSERTTSYIDSTHLQFAVPAADVATSGTVTLSATNPGSSASNTISVSVQ